MDSLIVDTYAWLEFFGGNSSYKKPLEKNILKTPVLVLAELKRSFVRKKMKEQEQEKFLEFVKSASYIIPLEIANAIQAGELAEKEGIPLADAIVYLYASPSQNLITGDEHFKGKKNVFFLK